MPVLSVEPQHTLPLPSLYHQSNMQWYHHTHRSQDCSAQAASVTLTNGLITKGSGAIIAASSPVLERTGRSVFWSSYTEGKIPVTRVSQVLWTFKRNCVCFCYKFIRSLTSPWGFVRVNTICTQCSYMTYCFCVFFRKSLDCVFPQLHACSHMTTLESVRIN